MQTHFTPAQLADPEVAATEQILRKCVHCGFCTATCPTYVLLGDELDSPRGRIYLMKQMLENSQPATATIVRHIDRCLSCLGCMTTCPSGVHYQHLIDHARAHVERTYRRPWRERFWRSLLAQTLPYPRRLRVALKMATLLRTLVRGGARRLPEPLPALLRLAPVRLPRASAPEPTAAPSAVSAGRVGLLAGCAQSVIAPQVHAASRRLLERMGLHVVEIEGCCGALVHHLGRDAHGREFAARIIAQVLDKQREGRLDAVIVDASGCGTQLKDYGHLFRTDRSLAGAAAEVSSLARDVSEVIHEHGLPPIIRRGGLEVAYHSPCSMQHGQRIDAAPRELLERAGFSVCDVPEGHLCCGSAGTYNVLQPALASRLRERKLGHIRDTAAILVATGNVGCMVQLEDAAGPPLVHTVELLDWATGGPAPAALSAVLSRSPARNE
jgi:glycolate oxidase iron-sulfur subunit